MSRRRKPLDQLTPSGLKARMRLDRKRGRPVDMELYRRACREEQAQWRAKLKAERDAARQPSRRPSCPSPSLAGLSVAGAGASQSRPSLDAIYQRALRERWRNLGDTARERYTPRSERA